MSKIYGLRGLIKGLVRLALAFLARLKEQRGAIQAQVQVRVDSATLPFPIELCFPQRRYVVIVATVVIVIVGGKGLRLLT